MSHDVSNDQMVDIFERLPIKSIIRFRSLSKYWHSRIATPEFVRHHVRCSTNPPKVLIRHLKYCGNYEYDGICTVYPGDQLPLVPGESGPYIGVPGFEFRYPPRIAEVVGSYNGILCMCNKNIILWNFSIRHKLIVSRHPSLSFSSKPSTGVALGFGFDTITDDYKIVAISYDKCGLNRMETFIYSLKKDYWRETPSPSTRFYKVQSKACFLKGILHWVVDGYLTEPSPEDHSHPIRFILTFDLSTNVFGHILFPRVWTIRQLTTVNGCLSVVSREAGDNWKIRVMKEYGNIESWSVLYEYKAQLYDDEIRVFQCVSGGDLLAYYDGSRVYNLQTGLLMKLSNFGPDCFDLEMETYVESLQLLDNKRATPCGETLFSWTRKDTKHKRKRLW